MEKVRHCCTVGEIFNLTIFSNKFGAEAVGARTASLYGSGSGSNKMMRLRLRLRNIELLCSNKTTE
jgi:hypothetical protein